MAASGYGNVPITAYGHLLNMSDQAAGKPATLHEHRQEAMRLLEKADLHVSNGLERQRLLDSAQVHAILALVDAVTQLVDQTPGQGPE